MLEIIKKRRTLLTAIGLGLAMMTLLSLRVEKPQPGEILAHGIHSVTNPFQNAYYALFSRLDTLFQDYIYLVGLKQENDQLKMQLKAMQEELSHHINSSVQFNLLREQLKFMEENPYQKVFAEVVGESLDNLHHTLLINKGARVGIRKNFPVVLREGVVGRIQSVADDQAVVELIVDRRHRFQVLVQRTRERMMVRGMEDRLEMNAEDVGIVVGTGSGLQVQRIRMLADIQKGDRVISSGLAGIFPKGLMVGTVTNVSRERHDLFQTAEIQPVVDFNKIEGVFVILRSPNDVNNFPMFTSP